MLYQVPGANVDLGWPVIGPLMLMLALFALGVPVWVSLGFCSVALLLFTHVLPMSLFGEALFDGVDAFALIAIPLYILTGDALVRSGLSNRLIDIAEATLGSLRSGLGTSTVLGCGFFSCISGSDAAGAAAVGRITYKRLVQRGYPPAYACALVAAGSCTGILIPPSISYIIIGLVLGISAATLFVAAAVPGIMIMLSIMITNVVLNRINGYENSDARFSFRRWLKTVWDGRYALAIPLIIWGGIYSGVFTPTEAAAAAVVVTIGIGFWQGTLELADFPKMLESSAKVNGVIVPIIAFALPLAQSLGGAQRAAVDRAGNSAIHQRSDVDHPDDARGPDSCRLRDGDDTQHRHPGADHAADRQGHRHGPHPFLHLHGDGARRRLHHAAARPQSVRAVRADRRGHPAHCRQGHSLRAGDVGGRADARLHSRAVDVGAALMAISSRRAM